MLSPIVNENVVFSKGADWGKKLPLRLSSTLNSRWPTENKLEGIFGSIQKCLVRGLLFCNFYISTYLSAHLSVCLPIYYPTGFLYIVQLLVLCFYEILARANKCVSASISFCVHFPELLPFFFVLSYTNLFLFILYFIIIPFMPIYSLRRDRMVEDLDWREGTGRGRGKGNCNQKNSTFNIKMRKQFHIENILKYFQRVI